MRRQSWCFVLKIIWQIQKRKIRKGTDPTQFVLDISVKVISIKKSLIFHHQFNVYIYAIMPEDNKRTVIIRWCVCTGVHFLVRCIGSSIWDALLDRRRLGEGQPGSPILSWRESGEWRELNFWGRLCQNFVKIQLEMCSALLSSHLSITYSAHCALYVMLKWEESNAQRKTNTCRVSEENQSETNMKEIQLALHRMLKWEKDRKVGPSCYKC